MRRVVLLASAVIAFVLAAPGGAPPPALGEASAAVPAGFVESVVFSGLTNPTAVRFAPNGKIFVAEKSGLIKVFDGVSDTTPTTFADLRTKVHNFWDRGLLGLAVDPNFPTAPYVYVLYTHDAAIGGTAPRWGTVGGTSDGCSTPPGPTDDGCVVSGRLSRLEANGDVMTGAEQVLIEDWCQQYPSHSVGSLVFGADGALYVSGGDGASFNVVDYGQDGSPVNPCGDPPGQPGSVLTPPLAQGGALRSQDLRTAGDPVTLDGTILRVDPATGAGLPDNPLAADADPNARRIIAYGLRNPFRITTRPGTNEVWAGDVGWGLWEEINRVQDPKGPVENFGWPCYEGQTRQSAYESAGLSICTNLYGSPGAVTDPFFTYHHNNRVVPNETCPTGSSSIAGLAFEFYEGGPYPASFDGALFFADYSRDCIWVIKKDANGIPAPGLVENFVTPAANPVDLQMSPGGVLFYADFDGGTIRRIDYVGTTQSPTAVATASPTSGTVPLSVNFDGTNSSDPDGSIAAYAWDLDGDGAYDDSPQAQPSFTYTLSGTYVVRLRVTDNQGAEAVSPPININVQSSGNSVPYQQEVMADSPLGYWRLGEASGTSAADSSGNNRTGAYLSTPTLGVQGALIDDPNSAVGFNGVDEYVEAPYTAALNPSQFTVEAWAFVTGGQGTYRSVVSSRDSAPGNARGYVLYASSFNTWEFWTGSGAWNILSGPAVALNTWTHLVGTYDGSTARLYVNGSLAASTGSSYLQNGQRPLRVASGSNESAPRYFLPGRVDEVAVYGAPLLAARVGAHYAAATLTSTNRPPTAAATATPTNGNAPLSVNFNGASSSDPDTGDTISFAWDLDGDGSYDDSNAAQPSFTYTGGGTYTARLRVTDNHGASSLSNPLTITVTGGGNAPPTANITAPGAGLTWKVGDLIQFSGSASDPQDGSLAASRLSWSLILHHCPSTCHTHPLQDFDGVSTGSFTTPDHEYPSHLELRLTATDSGGLTGTTSVALQPQTVDLSFSSSPSGLQIGFNAASAATPFTRTVIRGSRNSISAPSPQVLSGTTWAFSTWSDGGARSHDVIANGPASYTATYLAPPANTSLPAISGPTQTGGKIKASSGSWSGTTPITFGYQWLRCDSAGAACAPIAGATSNTYTLATADAGRTVRVVVTASNSVGSASATSAQTAVIRQRR